MSNDAPYMRWFVDDYLGDTGHLTCVEHGAYTQILWACWKRGGSVPEKHLPRLVGMTAEEWSDARDTLAEFFYIDGGTWTSALIATHLAPSLMRGERVRGVAWQGLRAEAFARDGFRCRYCDTLTDAPEADHLVPIAYGGTNEIGNVVTACRSCNATKGSSTDPRWRLAAEAPR